MPVAPLHRTVPRPPAWPIVIAGAGLPSLALALALRLEAGEACSVEIVAPARPSGPDGRAYALSASSVAFLERCRVWDRLAPDAEPVAGMRITDSRLGDAVRPDYLRFGATGGRDAPLAWIVEAEPMRAALSRACDLAGVVTSAGAIRGFAGGPGGLAVMGSDGLSRPAALLVAADGARSRLREAAGIGWVGRAYPQIALAGTVSHREPHRGIAVQHFLPGGPFALLPLSGAGRHEPYRSSLVWTEEARLARDILEGPPHRLAAALAERAGGELGPVAADGRFVGHPLEVGLARRFVGLRLALLGDAAHAIHPLAGQGLNLGLGDAAALARRVVAALRLGLDPGAETVLRAYERDRRAEAVAMAGLTDGLNRLFSNDRVPVRALRDLGLGLVDRAPGLKRALGALAQGMSAPRS